MCPHGGALNVIRIGQISFINIYFLSCDFVSLSLTSAGEKKSSLDQAKVVTKIPCKHKLQPSYYHSFGITENYYIFVEQPFVLNLKKFLLNAYLGKSFLAAMEWHSKEKVCDTIPSSSQLLTYTLLL